MRSIYNILEDFQELVDEVVSNHSQYEVEKFKSELKETIENLSDEKER